ncbi:MAG TPA: UdgX family uracil-DNA binding protein [Pseudonocardiaceae bacterium]|nr:UdgX family uracil-DNA binding protein [Pseudonocardiaceae bacterium]
MSAVDFLPETGGLDALRAAAATCQGCDLYRNATQTVFGEGRASAKVVMIGEQPGDREDRAGEPFVGPAGRLLDKALAEAGIDRKAVYLTNAVKHFSFRPAERGKRRIHQRPRSGQIAACRPWLAGELAAVRPKLVVCLGATAVQAVAGPRFRLTEHRGELMPRPDSVADDLPGEWSFLVTVHPSAVLRAPDRDQAYHDLVADLGPVEEWIRSR